MKLLSGSKTLDLSHHIAVVGVLNATPDSYVHASRSLDAGELALRAQQMVKDGADIIEIGGESTGPASVDVSIEQELERVIPAVKSVRSALPDQWISIDTTKAAVAEAALGAGADMINDVSAGRSDAKMFGVIAKAKCPFVMMYSKDDSPRTTKKETQYEDVIETIHKFLAERITKAREAGIDPSRIIVDPGLGHFVSSDPKYSFQILERLRELTDLGPVFVSPSRKSFLAGPENLPVSERLPATLAASVLAAKNGARCIRTHDVKETQSALDVLR